MKRVGTNHEFPRVFAGLGTIAILALVFASSTYAQSFRVLSQLGGEIQAVAAEGGYCYVGEGSGLTILDMSSTMTAHAVARLMLPFEPTDIWLGEGLACLRDGSGDLLFVDVGDPTSPTVKGQYDTPGRAYAVRIVGGLAYVADGTSAGLQILDLSDPSSPVVVGSYNPGNSVTDVDVSGQLAFACCGSSGVLILDVGNPSSPTLVGRCDPEITDDALDLCTSGSFVYVLLADHLVIFDAHDPSSPEVLVGCGDWDGAWGLALSGNYACVVEDGRNRGIAVVDVSTPTEPVLVGSYDYGYWGDRTSEVSCFSADERLVYVGHMSAFQVGGVLKIFDISTPCQPVLATSYYQPFWTNDIFVADKTVYLTDWAGMSIIDVNNPEMPLVRSLAHRDHWISGHDVFVSEGIAYMTSGWSDATTEGVKIMDVNDPFSPMELALYTYFYGNHYSDVYVSGRYAYVIADTSWAELLILDVSDPSSPTTVVAYRLDEAGDVECYGVVVSDGFAYLAVRPPPGLAIFDVSDPTSPTLQGHWSAGTTGGSPFAIQVRGSLAYLTWGASDDSAGGAYLIDVADASSPVLVGSFETFGSARDISLSGDLAYVTTYIGSMRRGNLHVIDIASPANPRLQATYESPYSLAGVWADGRVVYLCQSDWDQPECTQFLVLEYTAPASARRWKLY